MENQDFEIGIKTIWSLVIGSLLFTIGGMFAKIQHWEYAQVILSIGLIFYLATFVIMVRDINRSKIHDKELWIMFMIVAPYISPILYISRRAKMIKLRKKFGH
jgi:NADH:ubiquinone oxidoreductase subunit 6 (subunit J)